MAEKITLYTFGELVKELGISSNEANDLIASGELKPVRHKGRLKFKKVHVDKLKKDREEKLAMAMKALQQKSEEQYYTWQEVLKELQTDDDGIQQWIDAGEFQTYEGKDGLKFLKAEIERFKNAQQGKVTTPNLAQNLSAEFEKFAYLFQETKDTEEDYKFDQVLTILQMEPKELQRMVDEGEITVVQVKEGVKFKKSEVEMLRQERMIEATVVVPPENIVEENEEIVPIVISATSDPNIPVVQSEEEYYTFDEAAYELQLEPAQLKRMVARQEIEAIKDKDRLKFRKEDIDRRRPAIEPTVILPEETETPRDDEEETVPVAPEIVQNKAVHVEKSFCDVPEGAKFLGVTEEQILQWVKEKLLHIYISRGQKKLKFQEIVKFRETRSDRPAPAPAPASPEYYSGEEVLKLLKIEEKHLKIMVARGKLEVQRSGKDYQFLKASVDKLVKEKSVKRLPTQDIPLPDLVGKVESPGAKDAKAGAAKHKEVDITMVLPLTDEEEKETPSLLKIPESREGKTRPSAPAVETTMILPLDDKPSDRRAAKKPPPESKLDKSASRILASDQSKSEGQKKYYTQSQALMALQINPAELENLVKQGAIACKEQNGERYFLKEEINELQRGKMIEPTVVVEDDSDDILGEDEDDDIFFLK